MVSTPSLVRPFLDAAPADVRPTLAAVADLDRRLWTIVAEGRAAWPQLAVDAVHVVEFVARDQLDHMAGIDREAGPRGAALGDDRPQPAVEIGDRFERRPHDCGRGIEERAHQARRGHRHD